MDEEDLTRAIYVISGIIWLIIILYLMSTVQLDLMLVVLILLPLAAFWINFHHNTQNAQNENAYTKEGIMVSVVILIFSYIVRDYGTDETMKCFFHKVMYVIMFFFVLGLIDLWIPEKYQVYQARISSVCNTFALSLLLIGLYVFVRGVCYGEIKNNQG